MEQAVEHGENPTFPKPRVFPVNIVFFVQHLEFFGFGFRRYSYCESYWSMMFRNPQNFCKWTCVCSTKNTPKKQPAFCWKSCRALVNLIATWLVHKTSQANGFLQQPDGHLATKITEKTKAGWFNQVQTSNNCIFELHEQEFPGSFQDFSGSRGCIIFKRD